MGTQFTIVVRPIAVGTLVRSVRDWCVEQVVQTVPEDVSVCEYECQEPLCSVAKSAVCTKRGQALLRIHDAGEVRHHGTDRRIP